MSTEQEARAAVWLQAAHTLAKTPSGGSGKVALIVFALLACVSLPFGLFVLLSDAAAGTTAEEARKLQFGGYALVGIGLLMVPCALYQRRVIQRGRMLRESLIRAASQASGTVVDGVGVANWLGRHWYADYSQWSLMSHAEIFRVIIHRPDVSVLIDITPRGFTTGSSHNHQSHWWANVLVAVPSPLSPEAEIPNQASLHEIQRQGYLVQCEAGCLSARATPALEKTFNKTPTAVLEIFRVAHQLSQIASSMR